MIRREVQAGAVAEPEIGMVAAHVVRNSAGTKFVLKKGEIIAPEHLAALHELGEREIQSVLVEGGTETAGSFYDAELIDKVSFFIAPIIIAGKDAPAAIGGTGAQRLSSAMRLQNVEVTRHGDDIEVMGYSAASDK